MKKENKCKREIIYLTCTLSWYNITPILSFLRLLSLIIFSQLPNIIRLRLSNFQILFFGIKIGKDWLLLRKLVVAFLKMLSFNTEIL